MKNPPRIRIRAMNLESKISKVSRKFRRPIILGAIAFICPLRVITVNSPLFFRVGEDLRNVDGGKEREEDVCSSQQNRSFRDSGMRNASSLK